MKKRLTLKKNYEFRRLYRKGTSAAGGCMVIYCLRNRLGRCRLGLTASTKLGNAVKRNRARRRLREVFRLNLDALKPGYDVILVARSRTLSASWKEMNNTFLRLCRKLGMAKESGRTPDSGAKKTIPPNTPNAYDTANSPNMSGAANASSTVNAPGAANAPNACGTAGAPDTPPAAQTAEEMGEPT